MRSSNDKFYNAMCRYDLLCIEGLSQALRIFEKKQEVPQYKLADISKGSILKMHVAPEVATFETKRTLLGAFDD